MGLGSILRSGESQHPGPLGRCRGFLQADQNLTELDSTIRRDHDELTTLQWRSVILESPEPPDVSHETVADQVRLLAHHTGLLPGRSEYRVVARDTGKEPGIPLSETKR